MTDVTLISPNTDKIVSRLIESAETDAGSWPWYEWELGMLASRGVQADRVREWLAIDRRPLNATTRAWVYQAYARLKMRHT